MNIVGRKIGALAERSAVGEAPHPLGIDHTGEVLHIEGEAGDGNVGGVGLARFYPNVLIDVNPTHGRGGEAIWTIGWDGNIPEERNIGGLAIGKIDACLRCIQRFAYLPVKPPLVIGISTIEIFD